MSSNDSTGKPGASAVAGPTATVSVNKGSGDGKPPRSTLRSNPRPDADGGGGQPACDDGSADDRGVEKELLALIDQLNEDDPAKKGEAIRQLKELIRDHANLLDSHSQEVKSQADAVRKSADMAQKARKAAEASARNAETASRSIALSNDIIDQDLKLIEARARASASANANAPGNGGFDPLAMNASFPTTTTTIPGRPADEIVASMGQLSTLLIGTSPAFANAVRIQTDAVASGMSNLNAIANQQSHYTLDLAATARAVAETYSADRGDTHFHVQIAAPADKKK